MSADLSKAAMFKYLENVTRQGILNANTAGGLRAAAIKLLEDVADNEDVRNVDVEAMAIRYHNKHPGDISTDSLVIYKKRLTRLIADFTQYVVNPLEFKPKGRAFAKVGEKTNGRPSAKPAGKDEDTDSALTAAPECIPFWAVSALVSTLNSCRASGKGRGRLKLS